MTKFEKLLKETVDEMYKRVRSELEIQTDEVLRKVHADIEKKMPFLVHVVQANELRGYIRRALGTRLSLRVSRRGLNV